MIDKSRLTAPTNKFKNNIKEVGEIKTYYKHKMAMYFYESNIYFTLFRCYTN